LIAGVDDLPAVALEVAVLIIISAIVAFVILIKSIKKAVSKGEYKKEYTKGYALAFLTGILGICLAIYLMPNQIPESIVKWSQGSSHGTTSKWENLSDSEKAWYERNYGEGGGGRAAADVLNSKKGN
jgi:hypothetical protein